MGKLDAALGAAFSVPCHQSWRELQVFGAMLLNRGVSRVLEIGGFCGGTARFFSTLGAEVGCVDSGSEPFLDQTAAEYGIRRFHGRSDDPLVIDAVRAWVGHQPLDVLFIDGDHTIPGVTHDYATYAPFVKPGGLIVFHDVIRRPDNSQGQHAIFVPEFWEALKRPKTTIHGDEPGYGLGLVDA